MAERLPNWLKKRAFLSPERPAIEFENKVYTFKELHLKVEDMAERLAAKGIKQGDTCAVLLRNHIDSVLIIHALFYLGSKVVMLNHKLTANELMWQVRDSQVSFLISEESFSITLEEMKVSSLLKEDLNERIQTQVMEEFDQDATATIMYTSGTTGKPKGVIQTYGNHWWSAVGSAFNLGLNDDDSWCCAVPVFHISGLSILMRSVIYGMKVVLLEKFDEKEVNRSIREGVTICSAVPTMLTRMITELDGQAYPAWFRCLLLGGGPAPKHLLEHCKEKGIPVYQSYGMTETASQIVTLSPEDSLVKIGSAGKPLFPAQLRIEVEGRQAEPGEAGEIVVSGPNVTKGYLNKLEATKEAIKNGWLYTGDIGYVDQEGFLYVLDRRSDLIISGGENIYPAEIESVIGFHPAVVEVGVTGIPDDKWGEVPYAFVVRKENEAVSEWELLQFCSRSLAKYKIPKKVIFCRELPRNGANKLVRRKLKELV